jgi:hypothetical protein
MRLKEALDFLMHWLIAAYDYGQGAAAPPPKALFFLAGGAFRFSIGFLCQFVSFGRVFHGLAGILVPSLMVLLTVMRRGDTVCVCSEIVELCCSLVCVF